MAGPVVDDEEKPLDPAVERVRRRMIRFMVINIGILFVALAIVLGAIVYKTASLAPKSAADQAPAPEVPNGSNEIAGTIPLPQGARLVSHSLSGNRITLDVELADQSRALFLYDLEAGRIIGRYAVKAQ